MKDLATLKAACDAVINDPKLQPIKDPNTGKIIETHCNFGAMRVAHAMGCDELQGQTADQMYQAMSENKSGLWKQVDGFVATDHALTGGLAFAAMTSEMLGDGHGHIAAVYPVPMEYSPSLDEDVPMVANIGKTDAEEKESQAFPVADGEPDYFIWNG